MTFGFMDVERDPLVAPSETERSADVFGPRELLRSLESKDMAGYTAGARALAATKSPKAFRETGKRRCLLGV